MLDHLLAQADRRQTALVTAAGEPVAYGALIDAATRAAETLRRQAGDLQGRIVAVAVADPAGALIAMLGALQAGAAVWPVDPRLGDVGRQEGERRARPVLTITGADLDGSLALAAPAVEPRTVALETGLLLFTSGSSGEPKGVLLGRTGILANVEAILSYLPVQAFPRTALVLPLTYSYAIVGQAFVTLRAGGTLLLLAELAYPIRQVEAMAREKANGLSSVPTSLRRICEAAIELDPVDRPFLGYLASAGAPCDAITREVMMAAFAGARMFNQYGLTEACPRVTAIADDEPAFAAGSVGRPLPGIAVHAVDDEGRRLPPGEGGELVIQGPSVMLGYLDDPEATRRVLGPDGLRSGDMGRVDADGYVYVAGRRDGLVKCGGERVSLEEVASVLRRAPGVLDAYVVALPDDLLGSRLVAFVETGGVGDLTAVLRQTLKAYLPPAKRPQRIIQLPVLPRGTNGKVSFAELRQVAADANEEAAEMRLQGA